MPVHACTFDPHNPQAMMACAHQPDEAERIIVALDTTPEHALELAAALQGSAKWLKIGMTLYYAGGPELVRRLKDLGFKIFVDLKLHDIPHQVEGAAAALAEVGCDLISVHASGGCAMLEACMRGVRTHALPLRPAVVAITVLTSTDQETLETIGIKESLSDQVARLAQLARESGVDGVVCSPLEAADMRRLLGDEALVVTPGVRPCDAETQDQVRVATPQDALAAGASHLVIGRPITQADDPMDAFEDILADIIGA